MPRPCDVTQLTARPAAETWHFDSSDSPNLEVPMIARQSYINLSFLLGITTQFKWLYPLLNSSLTDKQRGSVERGVQNQEFYMFSVTVQS
jgi:hypothetical protein